MVDFSQYFSKCGLWDLCFRLIVMICYLLLHVILWQSDMVFYSKFGVELYPMSFCLAGYVARVMLPGGRNTVVTHGMSATCQKCCYNMSAMRQQ